MTMQEEELYYKVFVKSKSTSFFGLLKIVFLRTLIIGSIYMVGYFKISPAWLICLLILSMVSIIRDRCKSQREFKQQMAMAVALKNEKKLVADNINQLPPWVRFSEVDQCEWINKMLVQLWPIFAFFVKDILLNKVEPKINKSLSSTFKFSLRNIKRKFWRRTSFKRDGGFQFQNVKIGKIPPRIAGIRVYDKNVNRNEIIVDLNIFYSGDCDFSIIFLGLTGGMKDFEICGLLRIVLKPLLKSKPLIGGFDMFFLSQPKIDFNLIGATDFLEMPGLHGIMRKLIYWQLTSVMVLPNKISITSKRVKALGLTKSIFQDPDGVLCVNVIEAKDLFNKEFLRFFKGKSDPYVQLIVGRQTFKSKCVDNSLDPKWDFWAEFIIDALYGETIVITVMDKNEYLGDTNLGSISLEINTIKGKFSSDIWLPLEGAEKGQINLRMLYFQLSFNPDDYMPEPVDALVQLSSCVLVVYIHSAQLVNPLTEEKPDSFVLLIFGNKSQRTKIASSSETPVYGENFMFLAKNLESQKLHIKVLDQKSKSELGYLSANINLLLKCDHMELLNQRRFLKKKSSTTESTILLSLRLRILKKH